MACNIDNRLQDQSLNFDTDSSIVICDNSANVHVCFDKRMFIGELRRTDKHYVATIGGSKNVAQGMGTVRWRWRDDNGKEHAMNIENVLFFPQSPVNILSVTCLADQFKDDEGTGIDTKRNQSRFYWDKNRYQRTILHPASNLPELPVNEGFSLAGLYSRVFGRKISLAKEHCHCHTSMHIPEDGEQQAPADLSSNLFHVGETLLYTKDGHTSYARVEEIFFDDDMVLRFRIKTKSDESITVTRESLRAPEAPDIGWIPTNVPEHREAASHLSEEELNAIANPVKLSPLQEEFLALHERLWHLPFSVMFRLVKFRIFTC